VNRVCGIKKFQSQPFGIVGPNTTSTLNSTTMCKACSVDFASTKTSLPYYLMCPESISTTTQLRDIYFRLGKFKIQNKDIWAVARDGKDLVVVWSGDLQVWGPERVWVTDAFVGQREFRFSADSDDIAAEIERDIVEMIANRNDIFYFNPRSFVRKISLSEGPLNPFDE